MADQSLSTLKTISTFDDVVGYLRDELEWPIDAKRVEDAAFDYDPEELGIEEQYAAKVRGIKQIRPLVDSQPWGIFYIDFEHKRLPIAPLRRILRSLVPRKRQSASLAHRPTWNLQDLLFVCSHASEDGNAVTLVHFAQPAVEGRAARLTSFGWTSTSRDRTVLEYNLPPLRWPDDPSDAEAWRAQWSGAFDKQKLTDEFFKEYLHVFALLQRDLVTQTHDRSWAHDYALQLLNRCMFLYFIQRKRWMNNNPNFLKTFWDAYTNGKLKGDQPKNSFFERWLKVMFFEAFNNKFHGGHKHFPEAIRRALQLAPYLNGGLFQENDLDRKHSFGISDERFFDILTFLERYNFTVSEDTPLDQEVAVDAEMLGRVYETLVNLSEEADERGDAGIFYTPRTEIDLMCRLSLVDYLTNHLGPDHRSLFYEVVLAYSPEEKRDADAKVRAANLWPKLDRLLGEIAVVDPACGSGSFLVGMLQILGDLSQRVNFILGRQETSYERRKRIIGRSLYGVDVMQWAVEVAELRLWLQLVIETDLQPEQLKWNPLLPNLSFKIRCGDSLVQELGGINLAHFKGTGSISGALRNRLTRLRDEKLKYYNNESGAKYRAKAEIEMEELGVFRDILDSRILGLNNRLKEQRRSLDTWSEDLLDGKKRHVSTPEARRGLEIQAEKLRADLQATQEARAALKSVKDIPFVWDIAFVEIFEGDRNGFDVVIGNPPYVRQENISDPRLPHSRVKVENKRTYKAKLTRSVYSSYPGFFGPNPDTSSRKLDAKSDLYIYFYFQGLSLLNSKGSFCFITSNSWLDVGYGADLQEFLLRCSHVKLLLDNQAKRSFASADVNTVIVLLAPPRPEAKSVLPVEGARQDASVQTARFVMFRVPFEEVLSPVVFQEIEAVTERRATPEYRVYPIGQEDLFVDGCDVPELDDDEGESTARKKKQVRVSGPGIRVARYIGNKWGGKYLRAPDIYWTILEKGKGKLVRLGDIAEVRFGIKTGANEFFYLDEERIDEWGIEKEFLKPVIKSPRECKRILIDPKDLKYKIFMCNKDKRELAGTAALQYVKWGESQGFHKRPSCAGRARWWEIVSTHTGRLAWAMIHASRHSVHVNSRGVQLDHNFFEILGADRISEDLLCAYGISILAVFMKELFGRQYGGGSGPIKTDGVDIVQMPFPMADSVPFNKESREILNKYVCSEPFGPPFRENIRKSSALDKIFFDGLGLTRGERDAIYEAVINLVEARLKKAESLAGLSKAH